MKISTTTEAPSSNDSQFSLPLYPDGYTLQSSRLQLRAPVDLDVEGLWPFVTDRQITRFLAWEPHSDRDQTCGMLKSLRESQKCGAGFHWVICHREQVVGLISLIDVRRKHRCWTIDRAELAYWIGCPHQGQGLATEASAAVLNFAFTRLRFNRILLYHASENAASGAIAQKLGFRYIGEHREAFQKLGVWHSLHQYELLRSARKGAP